MTSWREIDRIRKDTKGFQAMARRLAALDDLTEWESAFLESTARKIVVEEFSTAQGEKLLQIRDDYELIETIRGFKVESLVTGCYQARLDLSEDDEDWIVALYQNGSASIKRKHAFRLMRCSARLGLIETDIAA